MSTLFADTLKNQSGNGPTALDKQNAAKVRGTKDSSGSSITGTLNVSSLDDDGTGDFGINFTSAFANTNYQAHLLCNAGIIAGNSFGRHTAADTKNTTSIETQTWYGDASTNATFIDLNYDIIIHGDLA